MLLQLLITALTGSFKLSSMLANKAEQMYFFAAHGWHLLLKALALQSSFQG